MLVVMSFEVEDDSASEPEAATVYFGQEHDDFDDEPNNFVVVSTMVSYLWKYFLLQVAFPMGKRKGARVTCSLQSRALSPPSPLKLPGFHGLKCSCFLIVRSRFDSCVSGGRIHSSAWV